MAGRTSLQAASRGLSKTQLDAMPAAAGVHMHQMLVRLLRWQAAQRACSSAQAFPWTPCCKLSAIQYW